MRRVLSLALVLALGAGPGMAQTTPPADLQTGIRQVTEGDLQNGLLTLDAAIRSLATDPDKHAHDLSQGYLYEGVAFVGLGQEERAKGSFAAALQYDKALRLAEDKFSPRVIRVFEAAREGKTKSVLLPGTSMAKKGGIGAVGIGLIVGGVALAGGAAAAAAGGSDNAAICAQGTPVVFFPSNGLTIGGITTFSCGFQNPHCLNFTMEFYLQRQGAAEQLFGTLPVTAQSFGSFDLAWDTRGFANGSYALRCAANYPPAKSSPTLTVTVRN